MPVPDYLCCILPCALIQIARYTMPFVAISAIFWLLHTWILDPVPNKFRRREFIRYRREILHVGTKLNFRSPARQVSKMGDGQIRSRRWLLYFCKM